MTKSYIGLARDHSASMSRIAKAAARDYNATITSIRDASTTTQQDTAVSVVELGYENTSGVRTIVENAPVTALTPIDERSYSVNGRGTPLWDAVGELIEGFKRVPDASDPDVAFLVMITTDGQENASRRWNASSIVAEINRLQATDRWTFVFRVPRGEARALTNQGIHAGNVLEWEQTERGVEVAQNATTEAMSSYMTSRSMGKTATRSFYANMANVKVEDVKAVLTDISAEVSIFPVGPKEDQLQIRDFVEQRLKGSAMLKGAAFYQLAKTELKVQGYKLIVIRDKDSGAIYAGTAARQLLGLPAVSDAKVHVDNLGKFDVFIQSTSVNRKVSAGTQVLYWPNVGKAFTEGKSAR